MRNLRKLGMAGFLLLAIFLISGGLHATICYLFGAPTNIDAIQAISAPFIGGFILIGFFGLMYTYKKRSSKYCLLGLLIALFCYGGIETIYGLIG